jgi:hypothetical protein
VLSAVLSPCVRLVQFRLVWFDFVSWCSVVDRDYDMTVIVIVDLLRELLSVAFSFSFSLRFDLAIL